MTQQDKQKRDDMSKYEKRKLCILVFIAAVLFVWAALSIGTIIQYFPSQAIADDLQQRTANVGIDIVDSLNEIVDRLDRLESGIAAVTTEDCHNSSDSSGPVVGG